MAEIEITKTLVLIADDGCLEACDTIEHEGKLWLVPNWHGNIDEGIEWPERIIGLHGLPTQRPGPTHLDKVDRELLIPLSRATLAGSTAQGLVVIEGPRIFRNVRKNGLH